MGSPQNCAIRFMRDKNFVWDPGTFQVLGIIFSTNVNNIVKINYEGKLLAMKKIMYMWKKRNITPYGKITVIKTLVFSKIVHLMINLPDPSEQFIFELEKELYSFLWNGKQSKIKKSVICKHYGEGGLRMLNIRSFLSSMKIRWLKRLMGESSWKRFTINLYPNLENVFNLGSEYADIISSSIGNPFWIDVMKHYKRLSVKCSPKNIHDLMEECIHYNVNFLRGQRVIFVKEWYNNDIFFVNQLLNETGNFLNYEEFSVKFPNVRTIFLLFEGIIKAIKSYCQKNNILLTDEYNPFYNKVWFCIRKGNKVVQNILNENNSTPTATRKWNEIFENVDWKKVFIHCHKTTQDTQLRWFQTRLLHRLLPTQKFLHLCKLVDSPICNFCKEEEQSISHMLFECPIICKFWTDFQQLLRVQCQVCNNFALDKELVLFGTKKNMKTDSVIDFVLLFAKFYIYKCKLQDVKPTIPTFTSLLKDRYSLEKYMHI